jgi:membrane protein required for colicin V production
MDQLGLTWFDVAGLAVVVVSAIMAFARGLIREIFSIIAFIAAAIAAVFFADKLRAIVEQITPLSGALASVGAGLIIFLIVFILITVLTAAVAKSAHQSTEIGAFDRAAGLAFGVLRGVLIVALFVLLMRQTTDEPDASPQAAMPTDITEARTFPIYDGVAAALAQLLPGARRRVGDIIGGNGEPADSPSATATVPPPAEPAPKQDAPAKEQ